MPPGLSVNDDVSRLLSDPGVCSATSQPEPLMLLRDWSWPWRLQIGILLLGFTTFWTHRVVLPLAPGWRRLTAAIPAIAGLIAAPFLFDPFNEPISIMTITFMSVRMPVTKLIAACFGRGPLVALPPSVPPHAVYHRLGRRRRGKDSTPTAARQPHSDDITDSGTAGAVPALPLVTFFMLCPVVPRSPDDDTRPAANKSATDHHHSTAPEHSSSSASCPPELRRTFSAAYCARGDRRRLLRELAAKWLAFAAATSLAVRYSSTTPLTLHAALAYGMLAIMGGMMDCTALYCTWFWGVDLVPPFHNPFAATSLADFWGSRWNVTQSRVLKGLLYDPITEGSLLPRQHQQQQQRPPPPVDSNTRPGTFGPDGGAPSQAHSDSDVRVGGNTDGGFPGRVPSDVGGGAVASAVERIDSDCGSGSSSSGGCRRRLGGLAPGAGASHGSLPSSTGSGLDVLPEPPATPLSGDCAPEADPWGLGRAPAGAGSWVPERVRRVAAAAGERWRNRRVRRVAALLAVFVFSGIEHEIFHWYVQRFISWQWLVFFTAHGVLLVAEAALRRAATSSPSSSSNTPASDIATTAALPPAGASPATRFNTSNPKDGGASRPCRLGVAAKEGRTAYGRRAGLVAAAGVLVAGAAAALARWHSRLPPWASRLLTLAVLEVTASLWFFDVLLEPGVVARVVGTMREGLAAVGIRV